MITSKDNKLIKLFNSLKCKKYSREYHKCFVESEKVIRELYKKSLIDTVLITEKKAFLIKEFSSIKYELISENIANFLSENVTNDGIFAIANIPNDDNIFDYSKCIILDRIQDPSNLGAIIRSAVAFGYITILTIDSVYPFSAKAIRSSMGYVFDVNFVDLNIDELIKIKENHNLKILSADMTGENIDNIDKPSSNYSIVIGNEGGGISQEIIDITDKFVSIPMQNNVESLNASVSASLIMYLLK